VGRAQVPRDFSLGRSKKDGRRDQRRPFEVKAKEKMQMLYNPYLFEAQEFFADMLGEYTLRLGDFWHTIDYERRRELAMRGESAGGGSSSRRNNGRGRANARHRGPTAEAIREAKATLRRVENNAKARARRADREIARTAREVAYQGRYFGRVAAARLRAQQRKLEQQARADLREAARARRALAKFLTPAHKRTAYHRRVVSAISRQVQRGEPLSIARAVRTERANEVAAIERLSDTDAIERAKRRLRQVFPNSANYDGGDFPALDHMPDTARALLRLSEGQIDLLIPQKTGVQFGLTLDRMMKRDMEKPSTNPLWYRFDDKYQYGI
jgi:hypothetical protein